MVKGEVHSTTDLVIEGRVDGPVWGDGQSVTIAPSACVTGDILARDITVHGTVVGTMVATGVVEVRPTASATGRVLSSAFILGDGATFNGSVQPQHLDAALSVARHRHTAQSGE